MNRIVVITGAGAGVGRATAEEFARNGCDLALISRDSERLARAESELRKFGGRILSISADVADADALANAATRVELELGPIDVWVNVAMSTVFSPVRLLSPAEVERGTAVTYLGQVYGIMAALRPMRTRNRGSIVCVGSALAYRSIPLQSVYCAAKFAIRGFVNSLRSELYHEGVRITLTEVDLPAINTPQFDWARNKTGYKTQPVPPIYQPEVAARAIYFGAFHPRRQIWVGFSSVKAILGNWFVPAGLDRYLSKVGYSGQLTNEPKDPQLPGNLFEPVRGDFGSHGRFDAISTSQVRLILTSRQRSLLMAAGVVGMLAAASAFMRRRSSRQASGKS